MKTGLFFKQMVGTIVFYSAIFFSAGKISYWQGLVYAGIGLIMIVLNYTILSLDKELIKERSKPGAGGKKWDKIILLLSFAATIAMFVLGGLDSGRYHWSPEFSPYLYVLGITFTTTGQLIFLIAQKQNKFFSSTVRIQHDRGHTVCENGLYKFVRHPAYMGSLIQTLAFPLLFGSVVSIIPSFVSMVLLLVRTSMEDQTLKQEFNGYKEYSLKVKYRLIPWFW